MAPGLESRPASRRSWSDLGPRLASAAVLVPLVIGSLYLGGYVFAAVVGAVFAGAYREWETMVTRKPLTPLGVGLIALVACAALVYPLLGPSGTGALIALGAVAACFGSRDDILWRVGGLVFFGLVLIALLAMRGTGSDGILAGIVLGLSVWMTDSAAFFTGRQIGGEKLAPEISPSKTWSGALGGLALGTAAGTIAWIVLTDSPWWIGVLLAAALSILGQTGDLVESGIKRRFRIKDSGDIIPGHGGLMDRLDSLTFGILFVFLVGYFHSGFPDIAGGFLRW